MFQKFYMNSYTCKCYLLYCLIFTVPYLQFPSWKKTKNLKIRITTNWVNLIIYLFNEDFTNCITLLWNCVCMSIDSVVTRNRYTINRKEQNPPKRAKNVFFSTIRKLSFHFFCFPLLLCASLEHSTFFFWLKHHKGT